MGRQKIKMEKIQSKTRLQVRFSKRRKGLFKKAKELCCLYGDQIGIIAFSPAGKPFTFSDPSLEAIIDRYEKESRFLPQQQHSVSDLYWWEGVKVEAINDVEVLLKLEAALIKFRNNVSLRAAGILPDDLIMARGFIDDSSQIPGPSLTENLSCVTTALPFSFSENSLEPLYGNILNYDQESFENPEANSIGLPSSFSYSTLEPLDTLNFKGYVEPVPGTYGTNYVQEFDQESFGLVMKGTCTENPDEFLNIFEYPEANSIVLPSSSSYYSLESLDTLNFEGYVEPVPDTYSTNFVQEVDDDMEELLALLR